MKNNRAKNDKPESQSKLPKVVELSTEIEKLRQRNGKIQGRLGVINAESSKLYSEQHANELRILVLMREHDAAAKG